VGHSLLSLNQMNTLIYIMFSRATSLEPKSQFTINLAFRRKQKKRNFPIKRAGENKKRKFSIEEREKTKRENSQSKNGRKQKKGKKIPNQGSEENRRNIQKGLWTRQYLNNTKLPPK